MQNVLILLLLLLLLLLIIIIRFICTAHFIQRLYSVAHVPQQFGKGRGTQGRDTHGKLYYNPVVPSGCSL